MIGKTPPQNLEAEQAVLGGLMLDPGAWDLVFDLIRDEDFYKAAHRKVFFAISELQRKNQPIDLLTVLNYLSDKNEIGELGGPEILYSIVEQTPSSANIRSYAEIIAEKSTLRKIIAAGTEIVQEAFEGGYDDISSLMSSIESKIFKINEKKKAQGLVSATEIVKESLEKIEELYNNKNPVVGIPSGYAELDKMTSGFNPGELIIIAARPSMGKTALGLNICANAAIKSRRKTAFFSLEMGREQLMTRLLASEAMLNGSDVRVGRIPDSAWPKLIQAASTLADAPLYIDDTSGISPYEILSKCRRLKMQSGLDMIVIDYLQMMQLKIRVESREREVSEISKALKAISKELKIPVVALAQLNRTVEGRSDRRPMLSDLRESGSIEQDADVIMMIYREDYYEKENSEAKGIAEILINKQRNGPTGKIKLAWHANYGKFADLAPESLERMAPAPGIGERPPSRIEGGRLPNFAPRGGST